MMKKGFLTAMALLVVLAVMPGPAEAADFKTPQGKVIPKTHYNTQEEFVNKLSEISGKSSRYFVPMQISCDPYTQEGHKEAFDFRTKIATTDFTWFPEHEKTITTNLDNMVASYMQKRIKQKMGPDYMIIEVIKKGNGKAGILGMYRPNGEQIHLQGIKQSI